MRLGPGGACHPRGVAEDGSEESSGDLSGGCGCAGGPDAETGEEDGHAGGSEASGRSPCGVLLREGVTCWEKMVEAGSVQRAGRFSGLRAGRQGWEPFTPLWALLSPGFLKSGFGWEQGGLCGLSQPRFALASAWGAQTLLSWHPSGASVPLRPHQASLRTGRRPAAVPGGGQLFAGGSSESSLCVYLCSSEHVTYKILFHAFSCLTLEH